MKYLLLVLGLVGCGRVGFSPVEHSVMFDGGAGGADSDPDTGEGTRLVQISDPAAELAPSISTELTVTAGSTLVVATYWDTRNNTVDITDTMGLQWLGNVAFQNTSCFAPPKTSGAMLVYARVPQSGQVTVTAQQSAAGGSLGMRVLEYARVGNSGGNTSTVAQGPNNEMSLGSFETTNPTFLVLLFVNTNGTGLMQPGTNFTARATDPAFYSLVEDNAPGRTGVLAMNAYQPLGVTDTCWVAVGLQFLVSATR